MKQRGFTLLEMVIGITLLGFVLVLLYGGLRLGTRSWDAGEKSVETASRQAAMTGYLRRQIGLTYPLRWKNDDGAEIIAFEGERDSVRFAAPIAARLGPGGVHLLAIEPEAGGDATDLRLRWQLPDAESKQFEFPDEANQAWLVRGLESVEFAYYGSEDKDTEPAWHDAWHSDTMLPQLLRMRLKPKAGEPWPDILVELKVAADATCRWDPSFRRCM
jgi:general secretion pathway protein J